MIKQAILVAGIGTGVGKTVVAAILVKMLRAEYWKPISCGKWEERDTQTMQNLVGTSTVRCHPEAYHFSAPLSPHHAAALEHSRVSLAHVTLPVTKERLIIESVGGILVPLNERDLSVDLFREWDCSWILVSRNYLGSINHTLLTIEVLRRSGVDLIGMVFNGPENRQTEEWITRHTQLPVLGVVREEEKIDPSVISKYGEQWQKHPFWNSQIG
jgi:dethiobiotin synthetase